jgi:hypothetical protein
MRTRIFRWLVLGILLAAPTSVRAQNEVIPRPFVGPLSHPRYEDGGFYTSIEFLYMKQRNLIASQDIVFRGFVDTNGSITGTVGQFVGDHSVALNTSQLQGPQTYSPGFNLTMGWRFEDGLAVQATWWHLADVRTSASASVIAPGGNNGDLLQNTLLFSPVFNLSPEFAGNQRNVDFGTRGGTYGIWNAASISQISFIQRFDMVEVSGRIPVMQTDNYRSYGTFGPRGIVMWERFKWRTVDVSAADVLPDGDTFNINNLGVGNAGDNTIGLYSNVVSNRFYGLFVGCGNEFRLGDTPVGTFSIYADGDVAVYGDFVKGRARYELADKSIAYTYSRNMFTLAPGFNARVGFQWYIYEAITIRLGYNVLGVFNSVASPVSVDFNMGNVHPRYQTGQFRSFDGLDFGIGFVW